MGPNLNHDRAAMTRAVERRMNTTRRFPRTEREAFGHPGHAIERHDVSHTGDRVVLVALVCALIIAMFVW